MKDKLLLVDGENLLHRSFHKFEKLKSSEGKPSGAIFGFFKSLHYLIYRFQTNQVVITFDNGKSKWRTDILPNYKGHRKNIKIDYESLQNQKRVIIKILKRLNISYIFDKKKEFNYEGDDYIALIKHRHRSKILVVSSDKDFCQMICKRVKIFNPSKDCIISERNCKEIMGYSAIECVDFLSLLGDSSDDIPGYPGIGEVKARKFLDTWNNIQSFLNNSSNEHPGISRDLLIDIYNRNKSLIDLNAFLKAHPIKEVPIVHGNFNKERLNKIFIKYSLTSFRSEEFLVVFKNLKTWKEE